MYVRGLCQEQRGYRFRKHSPFRRCSMSPGTAIFRGKVTTRVMHTHQPTGECKPRHHGWEENARATPHLISSHLIRTEEEGPLNFGD